MMCYYYSKSLRLVWILLCITFNVFFINAASMSQNGTFIFDVRTGSATVGGIEYTNGKGNTWGFKQAVETATDTLWLNGFEWEAIVPVALQIKGGDLVIELKHGSVNYITAERNETNTSALEADIQNLTITGSGYLSVEAKNTVNNSHGIKANNLVFNSGSIKVLSGNSDSVSCAIHTKGDLTINGGRLTVEAGNTGATSYAIHSLSDIILSGGIVKAVAGNAPDKGSIGIYAPKSNFYITNGSLNAIGNDMALYVSGISVSPPPYIYWINSTETSAADAERYEDMGFNSNITGNSPKYVKFVTPAYAINKSPEIGVTAPSAAIEWAVKGEKITFTVTPSQTGHILNSVQVIETGGTKIITPGLSDRNYTFTMPDYDVTITPTFTAILLSSTGNPLTARIQNTGNGATGKLRLTLSGTDEGSFALASDNLPGIPGGGYTDVTLIPAEGLEPGQYKVRLITSGIDNKNLWDYLDMTYTVADDPVSNEQIEGAAKLSTCIQDGILKVTGLAIGKPWQVYSLTGLLIQTALADSNEAQMMLPQKGIYIIASEGSTIKVIW